MDQGQALINPYNWLDENDHPVILRNQLCVNKTIQREVSYDTQSLLQINESSTTHIPQGQLVSLAPLRIQIQPKHIVYDQFMVENRLTENASAQHIVRTTDLLYDDLFEDIKDWELSLWSRSRIVRDILRASSRYSMFAKKMYKIPMNTSVRDQEWILCAETMRNYNPVKYLKLDNIMKYQNFTETNRLEILNVIGIDQKYNLYNRLISPYDNSGSTDEMVLNLFTFLHNPENEPILINSELDCLILWLLIPKSNLNSMLNHCLFILSILVLQKRLPSDKEWMKRLEYTSPNNNPVFGESPFIIF